MFATILYSLVVSDQHTLYAFSSKHIIGCVFYKHMKTSYASLRFTEYALKKHNLLLCLELNAYT
jgi:hypothetical protein